MFGSEITFCDEGTLSNDNQNMYGSLIIMLNIELGIYSCFKKFSFKITHIFVCFCLLVCLKILTDIVEIIQVKAS